ncbi:MAG TPA: helix-turn-helix transcriptional regulator [Gemmatimonadaceae bacterium]
MQARSFGKRHVTDHDPLDGDPIAESPWLHLVLGAVLLLVALGGAVDLALDKPSTWRSAHVLYELALMAGSLAFAAYLWHGWWRASQSVAEVRRRLLERQRELQAERDEWRASAGAALEGMREAIDRQFDAWGLTPTEREVALLLLGGHGHKQAAALTGRSERTIRQHAVSVYQKAGLSGRAELAAFFLEGLLPAVSREAGSGSGESGIGGH